MIIWVVFITTFASGVFSQGNEQHQPQQQQFLSQQSQQTPQQQLQQIQQIPQQQQFQQIPQQQQISQQFPQQQQQGQLQQQQAQQQQGQLQQQQAQQQQQPQTGKSISIQQNIVQPQNKQPLVNPIQSSGNQSLSVAQANLGSNEQIKKSGESSQDGKLTTLHPCLSQNISECFALISAQMNKTEELLQMANKTLGKKASPLENTTRGQPVALGQEINPNQNNGQKVQQQAQLNQGPSFQQPKQQQTFQTIQRQRRSAQEIIVETSGKSKGRQKITEIEDQADSENEDLEVEPMSVIHKDADYKVDTVVDVENLSPDKVEAAAALPTTTGPPKNTTGSTSASSKSPTPAKKSPSGSQDYAEDPESSSSSTAAKKSTAKSSSTLSPGTGSPVTDSTVSGSGLESTTTMNNPTIPGWFSLDVAAKRNLLANLTLELKNKSLPINVPSQKIPIHALASYPFLRQLFKRDTEHLHGDVEASIASLNAQKQEFQKLFSASKKMDGSNQEKDQLKSGSSLFHKIQKTPKEVENNIENTLAQIESLEEMIEKRLKPLFANIPKDDKDLLFEHKALLSAEEKHRPKRDLPSQPSPPVEAQSNSNFQQSPILIGQSSNQVQPLGNVQPQQQQQSQSNIPQIQTGMSQGIQQPLSGASVQNTPSATKTGTNQVVPNVFGNSIQGTNSMQQPSPVGQQSSGLQQNNLNQPIQNGNQTNTNGLSLAQNNSSNMPASQSGSLKTSNNLFNSPSGSFKNQMTGSNLNVLGGGQNSLNNTQSQTRLKPEDEEAKELSTAPKGLVLVVKEPGQSNLVTGQLVDGNLNPLNDSSSSNTMNNNPLNNKNSGFQPKSFGDKAGPRGIMIQEVFNRNQQNKGGNLHLQTQSSVNTSNNENNFSNINPNSKLGFSSIFLGQQNSFFNNSSGMQLPNLNTNNPALVQQRNNNGLDNNQQPNSFQQGSSNGLNMTSGLRKEDSNKMNEKGQQVRVMQPVGDRVSLHEANAASSERVQAAKESSKFDKVEAQPIFID